MTAHPSEKFRALKFAITASLTLIALPSSLQAQSYPTRPVKIVVPYVPGGPTDQLSRALADRLTKSLGQAFIVENKPGGNTIVGATQVANAPPDGYTLFLGSSASLAVNPLLYPKLSYNPDRDFVPISLAARAPLVMVVNSNVPAKNLSELVSHIKAQNGKFAFASNGIGNPLHLACELFRSLTNVDMIHVPYNGTAPALTSILAGDTQMMCDIALNSLPNITSGKVRAIGIAGPTRVAVLPNVPTLSEQGLADYDATVWFAIVAPRNTPPAVVSLLNQEIVKALADPTLREKFDSLAMELRGSTPQELVQLTAKERKKWAEVIARYKIKAE